MRDLRAVQRFTPIQGKPEVATVFDDQKERIGSKLVPISDPASVYDTVFGDEKERIGPKPVPMYANNIFSQTIFDLFRN